MNSRTKNIVICALFAALVCVTTMIVKIPSPLKGYINIGDCIVLLCGWMLSPAYGFLAAGVGSALADLFSGYVVYAPATFVIKGLMALIAFYVFRLMNKNGSDLLSRVISGGVAEITMILGYLIFEGILYGFAPSLVNIPPNAIQGVVGMIIGIVLIRIFEKRNLRL